MTLGFYCSYNQIALRRPIVKNMTNPTIIIAPIIPPTMGQGTVVCSAGGVGVVCGAGGVGVVCGAGGVVGVSVGCVGVVCGAGGVGVGVGCGRRAPALIAQSTSNPLDIPVIPEVAPVKMML